MSKHRVLQAFVCGFSGIFTLQAQETVDPAASREMIKQWVQTERLISEEKNDWKVQKQSMQDLLDLYQKELKLLNEEIEKAGSSAKLGDERKGKLESELVAYREAQRLLSDTMARLLPRATGLIGKLPTPLKDELDTDIKLLSAPDALQKPRDVLKSMLSVMTTAGRFNRTITLAEESRKLADGSEKVVDVLYLGLARAYFVTGTGDVSGIGVPDKDGWKWGERPELADDVRAAIAVYHKDKQPQLIQLPVGIVE